MILIEILRYFNLKRTVSLLAAAGLILLVAGCSKDIDPDLKVRVNGVDIAPTSLTLTPGTESSVTVSLTPVDATEQRVCLTSSNSEVLLLGAERAGTVTLKAGEIPILAMAAGNATISVTTLDGSYKTSCTVTVKEGAVRVTSISLSPDPLSMRMGNAPVKLTATVSPANASEKSLFWTSSNEKVATVQDGLVSAVGEGEAVISAIARDGSNTRGECHVIVEADLMAIDLGLSVLWANVNVGADVSSECGSYFAWGETASKTKYTWDSYSFGTESALTKYTGTGPSVLEADDDAARKNQKDKWRMPAVEEMKELREKCSWAWSSRNGQNGFLVTAKNGNSIFLPAAGSCLSSDKPKPGKEGVYWTSSRYSAVPSRAWMLSFTASEAKVTYSDRCYGHSVRAVLDK